MNEDLDVPNNRALFGYVPTHQLLAVTRVGEPVVLRPDSVTSWEVLAADALLLRQHGRTVRIVATDETRLLFDDSLLVSRAAARRPSVGGCSRSVIVAARVHRRERRRPPGAVDDRDRRRALKWPW